MKRFLFGLASLLSVVSSAGCSSSPSDPVPAPGAATSHAPNVTQQPDDVTPPAQPKSGGDISTCHSDANTAPAIASVDVAEDRPAFTGGTITDGIYHRTGTSYYTGAGGKTGPVGDRYRQTLRVTGNVVRATYRNEGEDDDRTTFTFTTSGAAITYTATCPDPATGTLGFTATTDELRMGNNATGELIVYTRAAE